MDFLRRDVERGAQRGAVLFNKPLVLGSMPKTNLRSARSERGSLGCSHSFLLSPPTILYKLNRKEKVRGTQ